MEYKENREILVETPTDLRAIYFALVALRYRPIHESPVEQRISLQYEGSIEALVKGPEDAVEYPFSVSERLSDLIITGAGKGLQQGNLAQVRDSTPRDALAVVQDIANLSSQKTAS